MNILLITQLPPPNGGIATWSEAFLSEFERLDENHYKKADCCITVANNAIVGKRAEQINGKKSVVDELRRIIHLIKTVKGYIKTENIDIVHNNITCARLGMIRDLLILLFIPKGVQVCAHCHCNISDQVGGSRLSLFLFRRIAKKSDLIITLNEKSRKFIEELNLDIKCTIVPNAIEARYIHSHSKSKRPIKTVVFTGRFEKRKGSDTFVEVAKHLPNVKFKIVGTVDGSIPLESLPANIKSTGNVTRDRVFEELDRADAFLFPSLSEGFSMSLLEAMARGLPVVAFDVGANNEMIGQTGGFILRLEDIKGIVDKINLLNNADLREVYGNANIRKVESEYTTQAVVRQLMSIYKSMRKPEMVRGSV